MAITDLYFSRRNVTKEEMQLVGITAVVLACKFYVSYRNVPFIDIHLNILFQERYPPYIEDFVMVCDGACSEEEIKGSSDSSHLIFVINVGEIQIRHATTLKLNDEFLNRLKIAARHSNSESFYVGSDSFRH